ncbi:hypothetical protein AAFF_G00286050 [Aldrovandia affinis]|uniref:Uncharacterized protein n=1 Tax=Aldrovandia affinis TaxID=143900 RepID=A0AAD7TBP3_9TELE|nr:hypothetical protein AAFF_G00286050 [Aldrovandia affinis]
MGGSSSNPGLLFFGLQTADENLHWGGDRLGHAALPCVEQHLRRSLGLSSPPSGLPWVRVPSRQPLQSPSLLPPVPPCSHDAKGASITHHETSHAPFLLGLGQSMAAFPAHASSPSPDSRIHLGEITDGGAELKGVNIAERAALAFRPRQKLEVEELPAVGKTGLRLTE